MLGGGIRGLFRVDRSWRPKTAVAAAQPTAGAASGGGGGRGWAGAQAGSGGDASGSDTASWTAVAVAPAQSRAAQQQQQQQPAAGDGEQQPASGLARWAVMTGRRAARPGAPAAGAGASRNLLAELVQEQEDAWTSDDSSD